MPTIFEGANGIEQERTFVYDNRGFLLSESHPELGGSGQGSFGYSGYDVFGNPGRVLNNARDLRFTYDPFGRLTQVRDGQNGNRLVKEFAYDTAVSRGEGKLAEAVRHNWVTPPGEALQDVQVAETYVYQGTAGALSSRTTYIGRAGGLEFEEQYTYDTAGQLIGLTYPECRHEPHICDGSPPRTVNFTYNLGHLRTVSGFTGSGITYHPDGSWATIPHGNGVTDLRDVQTGNPGRTARLYSTGASWNYNSGFFSYDGAGHIIQMGNQAYVYDAVGRLKGKGTKTGGTWDPPGPQIDWEWRYQYDAYGNLNQHRRDFPDGTSQTRSFAIDVNKNRLASANYDTTGNLLSWGGGSYGYDESGNLQAPHSNLAYLYTASDERIGRIFVFSGTQYEEYTLRSASGQVLRELWREDYFPDGTVGWNRDYVWWGGQLLATVHTYYATDPADTRHYTLNHLGSPALVTDGAGQKMARYAEAPFGEDMTSSSDQNYFQLRFTGHERDYHGLGVLDDLDYMHARHYTPYVGRFLQVDPVLGSTGSPQSWNRYAYVQNSPVNFTDPTGMLIWICRPDGEKIDHDWSCVPFGDGRGEGGGGGGGGGGPCKDPLECGGGGPGTPPPPPPPCEETGTCPPPPCEETGTCPPPPCSSGAVIIAGGSGSPDSGECPVTTPTKPKNGRLIDPRHPLARTGFGCNQSLQTDLLISEYGKTYAEFTLTLATGAVGRGGVAAGRRAATGGRVAVVSEFLHGLGVGYNAGDTGVLNPAPTINSRAGRLGERVGAFAGACIRALDAFP